MRPEIKKEPWTDEEILKLMQLYLQHGSSWSKISESLPGRTSNQIKNRYNSVLKKHYIKDKFDEMIEMYKIRIKSQIHNAKR